MKDIFDILKAEPTITIISTAVIVLVVIVLFMILFKEQIKQYLIKKYDLYTKEQVQKMFTREQLEDFARYSAKKLKRSQGLNVSFIDQWLKNK